MEKSKFLRKQPGDDVPYIRVGVNYFKRIQKENRYGIKYWDLKEWKKDEIRLDYGAEYLKNIPKYDDFVIIPNNISYCQKRGNCFNLYKEFSHTPTPGTWDWTNILLEHIFDDQYYLGLRYLQMLYLHPERMAPILVLVSKVRQTGKTTFINWLNMIFGGNVANISPKDLVNGFNSIYATSNIIAVEETLIDKDQTIEDIKALSTQKQLTINPKYVNQYRLPFFGKIILTSNNEEKFARIDEEEIRFFVRKVGLPKHTNHSIEDDLLKEIPAFLHYLTTLPPIDFSTDRTGFTPNELNNEYLRSVKDESKSWLYKELMEHFESEFLNDCQNDEYFFADPKGIKERYYRNNNQVTLPYIRTVLKDQMKMIPSEKAEWQTPFKDQTGKTARFYKFYRDQFVKHNGLTDKPF
jgi:hypothetical protein